MRDHFKKLSFLIDMSFDIPDSEKRQATECMEMLSKLFNLINIAEEHLDIMYDPFSKGRPLSPEAVYKKRAILDRFKKKVRDNFSLIKYQAILILKKIYVFYSDTHIMELSNALKDSSDVLEKSVIQLLDYLDDFKSNTFQEDIVKAIDDIKKNTKELKDLIKDRIEDYLDTNILTKNLTEGLGIEEKIPVIKQLYQERQQNLEGLQTTIRPQILNPGNAQRMYYPADARESGPVAE